MKFRLTITAEYEVTEAEAKASYNSTDPADIIDIDEENFKESLIYWDAPENSIVKVEQIDE